MCFRAVFLKGQWWFNNNLSKKAGGNCLGIKAALGGRCFEFRGDTNPSYMMLGAEHESDRNDRWYISCVSSTLSKGNFSSKLQRLSI